MKSILKDVERISFFKLVPTGAPRLVGMLHSRMLLSGTPLCRHLFPNSIQIFLQYYLNSKFTHFLSDEELEVLPVPAHVEESQDKELQRKVFK